MQKLIYWLPFGSYSISQSLKNSICSYLQYLFIAVTVQNRYCLLLDSKTINYEILTFFFLDMFLQAAVILVLRSSMLLETVLCQFEMAS